MEELVFAIPTIELWKILPYKETGLIGGNRDDLNRIVKPGLFMKRSDLEEDPSFKQIIPYGIISNRGSYLLFTRTSGQQEKRLHHHIHLGVGGHMNPSNSFENSEQYVINELKREFFEEVKPLNGCFIETMEFIGFINDDSIAVGRAHIGLLYDNHVSNQNIIVRETDKMTANWISKTGLIDAYAELETWTQIAIDHYIRNR